MASGLYDIAEGVSVPAGDAAEVWALLDRFMANSRVPYKEHLDAHLETLLFPHVRIASQQVNVFPDAASYGAAFLKTDDVMQSGFDHSEWTSRRIVQADPSKVHVAVTFERYTKDNSPIATERSLYVIEKIDGRWGIRGRSSFAQ
ncbi:hypothetical protein ACIGKR_32405 [Rhodococcus qingshengii]|uniref:hypothetical protein n=1 Tax=Rhodococcus qingshengii TaxID=334542 RepID=UPI0037C866D1